MAPYFNILGIDLYTIMICIGLLVAIVLFRILCDKKKLPANVFNFFIIVVVGAILVSFLSATLFLSFYNFLESGVWNWSGMTFLGELIGGVVCFLLFYFLIGHFLFKNKEHIVWLDKFVCCAIPCIVVAHAFVAYGVWRFAIEYLRDDPRGDSGISFLTPSQLSSVLLVVLGVALIFFYLYCYPKLIAKVTKHAEEAQENHDAQE